MPCGFQQSLSHPGQRGASLQGDQAAVWIHEGALPAAEEEHAAAQDAVCAVQSLDGAPPIAGGAGMSAPEIRQMAAKAVQESRTGLGKQGPRAA